MAARFLRRFRRSSTSKVNFSMLTKRLAPILLSKLSENTALSGKWIKLYVNFGVRGPLNDSLCSRSRIQTRFLPATGHTQYEH